MEMNLQKYLAFVKTVECGSFTKAAEELRYSQSGISHMIIDLEKGWNVALVERRHGGVQLTADGKRLLPHIQRLCEDYTLLQKEVKALNGLENTLLRIGVFASVAIYWIPQIIQRFQRDYPEVRYELLTGDYTEIEEWIANGRVDCGFVCVPSRPEFDVIELYRDDCKVLLPKNHPLTALDVVPIQSLKDEPLLLIERGERKDVSALLKKYDLLKNVRCTTLDDFAGMSMVEQGLGICLLPQLILTNVPFDIAVRDLDESPSRTIGFAMRSQQKAPLVVRRFLEYVI